jgi:hypothetical protein
MKGNPVKKETKEKIKNWAKSEAPWLAVSAAGLTAVVVVFKKYTDDYNEIYEKNMHQRTEDLNRNYINYLGNLLDLEKAKNQSEE